MRPWWVAAAAGLALLGALGWWFVLRGPAPPEPGVVMLVPEGGATLGDVNPRFAVTLPAGWLWTVRTGKGGALWVNAAKGDGPGKRLNENWPGKLAPGEAVCSASAFPDEEAEQAGPDDAQKRMEQDSRRDRREAEQLADRDPAAGALVQRLTRAEMSTVNEVPVALMLSAAAPKDGVMIVTASAFATHDGAYLSADCETAVDATQPNPETAPGIDEIIRITRSLTPR